LKPNEEVFQPRRENVNLKRVKIKATSANNHWRNPVMKLTDKLLKIDPEATQQKITRFIRDYAERTDVEGIVLGISGGVDSAATAVLCTAAIGSDRVLALYMPEEETYNKTDHRHIALLAEKFKLQLKTIDLSEALKTLYKAILDNDQEDKLSRGNLKARIRMLVWYYYANHRNLIVAACSDKSETMIGYCTKWGDAAGDIAPIMDLYKTQVQQLALHLGIPPVIARKPPTPALWPDQTAEREIGLKYKTLDLILYGLEHFMEPRRIAKQLGLPAKIVTTVKKRWLCSEHKRRMPLTAKLEYRTVNHDFRLSRTIELGE
jgi:NAD+ synthase